MIMNLLKYEMRRTTAGLAVITAAAALVAIISMLTYLIDPALAFVLLAFTAIGYLFAVQVYLMIEFYRSTFGTKTASFLHTLPVSGRTVFFAKAGYMVLARYAAGLLVLLVAAVTALTLFAPETREVITYFQQPENALDRHQLSIMSNIMWFFSIASLVTVPLDALTTAGVIVIGSNGRMGRLGVGGPILTVFGYFIAAQILAMVLMFIPPLFNYATWELLPDSLLSIATDSVLALDAGTSFETSAVISLPVMLLPFITAGVFGWIGQHLLNRKLDLQG